MKESNKCHSQAYFKLSMCFLLVPNTDVEAFAKAMESESKSDQDSDPKDKKDNDEDMSLD